MKFLKSNKFPLVVFAIITFVGVLLFYIGGEKTFYWNFFTVVDTASAVALSVLAFLGYMEFIKSEEQIKIYFKDEENKLYDTGLSVLRKNCTRSEVFGLLGMIQKDLKHRYELNYMKNKELLEKLQEIQKGDKDKFIIPATAKELEQFELFEQDEK